VNSEGIAINRGTCNVYYWGGYRYIVCMYYVLKDVIR
jgi:hypothetical protein